MELFNPNQVVRDLQDGKINEKDSMKYLAFTLVFEGFNTLLPQSGVKDEYTFKTALLFFVISIAVGIWGTLRCYRANGRESGKEFIKRYVCVSVPVNIIAGLATIIGLLVLSPIVAFITRGFPKPDPVTITSATATVTYCFVALIFVWKARLLSRVAARDGLPPVNELKN